MIISGLVGVTFVASIILVGFNQEASGMSSVNLPKGFHNIFFNDSYSSNVGWTQVGSGVTVNDPSFPGVVEFNNVAGGQSVTENRVYKALPAALPDKWLLQFDYKFTHSTIPTDILLALTTTSADPQKTPANGFIFVGHGRFTGLNEMSVNTANSQSTTIPISANTTYYVTLEKTSSQLTLSIFSDPSRTIQIPGSPVTANVSPSDFKQNLEFIQHDGCFFCGSARTLTADIDNTEIFTKGNQ